MGSIVFHSRSGRDGILDLDVSVGKPDAEFEVEVVVRPKPVAGKAWPPGYFDLFGSIDDGDLRSAPARGVAPSRGPRMIYLLDTNVWITVLRQPTSSLAARFNALLPRGYTDLLRRSGRIAARMLVERQAGG